MAVVVAVVGVVWVADMDVVTALVLKVSAAGGPVLVRVGGVRVVPVFPDGNGAADAVGTLTIPSKRNNMSMNMLSPVNTPLSQSVLTFKACLHSCVSYVFCFFKKK